ncbi:Translation machinery-associated protein 22 [Friedmanniomyces endolithicus]|uniref:Translation machinery-associated protein 22 n=1 Tax=Friedmanniomyces endolithicus TaxID=329885 RepID=A0AAN6JXX2_9PEZI|nr:Translation machinery-associated protein 22 [Friedmanniomyces endolithicus]KAK0953148.1 Translation machinery-associated protein 22 [Friedmanniomyces endolithicus]KAK0974774.1 Translation machinery-associated protein 22 [Friedmanniomyces endolithicus]KAK1047802.1 Translation machinery-associated protein 22 [Friedmanniomyces endolithicus]
MADTATATDARPPRHVVYCGVCTLPPEYCEYGGTTKKCSDWLLANHPDLHSHLYSEDAATKGMSNLSLDAQKRADKDAQKKAAKAEAAEAREKTARAASKVYIKRVERNKRKYVTEVSGLEAFGLDLKKIAKEFGKKFATGSSVTKNAGGTGDEITVQGDVSEDIFDWLQEHHGEIPEDNIELIEDKKKKASAGP